MELFKKSPDKLLIAACADVDKLIARLAEAEQAVIAKRNACEELALAPDAEQRKAESAFREAQDHVNVTLAPALKTKRAEVQRLEREVADIVDKQLRAKTAPAVEQLAADGPAICAELGLVANRLSEWARRATPIMPDAKGIEIFATSAPIELQAAVDMVAGFLRNYATAVLNGSAPAALPVPVPIIPQQPQIAPPTTRVFTVRAVAWKDAAGEAQTRHRYCDIDVPVETAKRAIACGAAVSIQHELRGNMRGFGKTSALRPQDCEVDLDDPDAPVDAAPIPDVVKPSASVHPLQKPEPEIHSEFTRVDRGPAYPMRVSRNEALPASATRNLPNEDKS